MAKILVEVNMPRDTDFDEVVQIIGLIHSADTLILSDVDCGLNPLVVGRIVKRSFKRDVIVQLTGWNKTEKALFSDLLTCSAIGLNRILISPDVKPQIKGVTKPVTKIDPAKFVKKIKDAQKKLEFDGMKFWGSLDFEFGVTVGNSVKSVTDLKNQIKSGVNFAILREWKTVQDIKKFNVDIPVYPSVDVSKLKSINTLVELLKIPNVAGLSLIVDWRDEERTEAIINEVKERFAGRLT
jgi:5,10-methylenetetrahydrofolate reductase